MALPLAGLGITANRYSSRFQAETAMFEFIGVFADADVWRIEPRKRL